MLNQIPAPVRTLIYLAIVGAIFVLASRYMGKFAGKASL